MDLYVCWNVKPGVSLVGGHPCGRAYGALIEAGHDLEVIIAWSQRTPG